jgi:hypothetical protein
MRAAASSNCVSFSRDGLKITYLRAGDEQVVRLLPWLGDPKRPWARLCEHRWPPFQGAHTVTAVCPAQTDSELLQPAKRGECSACKAGVELRPAVVVYASVPDKRGAILLRVYPNWLTTLRQLIESECLDLAHGRHVLLRNQSGRLEYELLEPAPVDMLDFEAMRMMEEERTLGRKVNKATLKNMAKALEGWQKAGEPVPDYGYHLDLLEHLPHCRFIRIAWAFKGPNDWQWQQTPYSVLRQPYYYLNLDRGNVGLITGWDWAAVQAGLTPPVVVIGLDADTEPLRQAFLKYDPWLDKTFAVLGARGLKWFFGIEGPGADQCLRSCKIKTFDPKTRKSVEVGDWLAQGKQGVVCGLHPGGIFYRPNNKPLHIIKPEEFVLPPGYSFSSDSDSNPAGYEGFRSLSQRDQHAVGAVRIRRLLEDIDGYDDRGTWFTVLCGMKSWGQESGEEQLAYELAAEWSKQSHRFNEGDQRSTWDSLRRGPGAHAISVGSLYHLASSRTAKPTAGADEDDQSDDQSIYE